jgi:hypothetical protein
MSQTFAQLVERVKQLSPDEKRELQELLNGLLIERTGQKANGKRLDLAELVSRMPADYQGTEEGFGDLVGKEEW